jgi:dolichol-phosphate mannosyltransferase
MRLSLVIPCFNEEASLALLGDRLARALELLGDHEVEVLFVDDGSTDGTPAGLERLAEWLPGVRVVTHERNRGLGAALRTGYAEATGDVLVGLDSDCTYDPTEVPELIARMASADVVLGSPYNPEGATANVPVSRLVLSRTLSGIYRWVLGTSDIYTFTGIFRAHTREAATAMESSADDYRALTEMLVSLLDKGYRVVEYPTVLHSRVTGSSKMRVLRMIGRHAAMVCGLAITRPFRRALPKEVRNA